MLDQRRICIIGGGIFGLTTAILLSERGHRVTVVERHEDVMRGASFINQNRMHLGYHYPRSLATGEEAISGIESFAAMYGDAIVDGFTKYYAIATDASKTSVEQFMAFCQRLALPLAPSEPPADALNLRAVRECWAVPERIFDYGILRNLIRKRLMAVGAHVTILRLCWPTAVEIGDPHRVVLNDQRVVHCDVIINATYTGIPGMLSLMGQTGPQFQFELCVMPVLELDDPPGRFGITVMDGPFCSIMSKGYDPGRFILYHVEKSVVQRGISNQRPEWRPIEGFVEQDILNACAEYLPIVNRMRMQESWITTRVVLASAEADDARPTLVIPHAKSVFTVFSGKLTTCVDVAQHAVAAVERSSPSSIVHTDETSLERGKRQGWRLQGAG